jgi:maltose O-acetyltransferase
MKTEKDKMLLGEPFNGRDKVLFAERKKAKQLLYQLNVKEYITNKNTSKILRELLPNAALNIYLEPPFYCDYGYNIVCGENVYFNFNCVVLDSAKVTIGSNVMFGPCVQIYTSNHPQDSIERRLTGNAQPITIGNDCWIGGNSIILPGVSIGSNCIIGAGSVVTKDVLDNTLAAGNPAKKIKNLL